MIDQNCTWDEGKRRCSADAFDALRSNWVNASFAKLEQLTNAHANAVELNISLHRKW